MNKIVWCSTGSSCRSQVFFFLLVRFFFGKNKVMTIALGKDKEAEYKENLHKIANVSVQV